MPSIIAIPRPTVKGWRETQRTLAALRRAAVGVLDNMISDPTEWTSTWTATTTNPTIGTNGGSFLCRYFRYFRFVVMSIYIQFGVIGGAGGWAVGSGTYEFTLPITPLSGTKATGNGFVIDDSTDTHYILTTFITSSNLIRAQRSVSTLLDHNSPIGYAANDEIILNLMYPAAEGL